MPVILVPYTKLQEATIASLEPYQNNVIYWKIEDDLDYYRSLQMMWNTSLAFTLVEHDMVIPETGLEPLWRCAEPWCGYPYYRAGFIGGGFGITHFSTQFIRSFPSAFKETPFWPTSTWKDLDHRFKLHARAYGFNQHLHLPIAEHITQPRPPDAKWQEDDYRPKQYSYPPT